MHSPPGLLQLRQHNQPSCSAMLTYPASNRQTKIHVLIDSGNSLDHCAAITLKCAQSLGLKLLPCDMEVNTADRHHTMKPCDQINNMGLIFTGKTETAPLDSILVLPDLNGDVNLGYKFLKKNQGPLSFEGHMGRPSLHLPRLQNTTTGPILL